MIAGWCIQINLLIGLEDPIEEDHRRGIKISDAISTKKAMAIDFKTSFILTPGPTPELSKVGGRLADPKGPTDGTQLYSSDLFRRRGAHTNV